MIGSFLKKKQQDIKPIIPELDRVRPLVLHYQFFGEPVQEKGFSCLRAALEEHQALYATGNMVLSKIATPAGVCVRNIL